VLLARKFNQELEKQIEEMKKSQLKAADDTAVHCVIHNDREKDMPMKQRDMIHQ